MAEKKETKALEVVSHALTGSLDEKVRAFEQMASAMAQLQLNGWDSVQKCKAGFWLADGIGEHPAVFIQNHYVMLIKGRLTIEPMWPYMVRKLKETVPGFTFKVLVETDDCAKVEMSDGVDTHVVEYTLEDARRQGLLGKDGNAWTTGNTREMCFKQAVKRAARRIGVGRQAPWVEMDMEDYAAADAEHDTKGDAEREISGAVVEGAEDKAPAASADANASSTTVAGKPQPSTPTKGLREGGQRETVVDRPVIMRLSDALVEMYGKQKAPVMLQKATLIYNEMVKANTGTNPGTIFKKVEDIGPVDAELMIEYIANRSEASDDQPANGNDAPTFDPPASGDKFGDPIEKAAFTKPPADDEPPPAEGAEPEPEGDEYEKFVMAVKRAKKVFGRKFMIEAPPGGGVHWFIDQTSFSQAGYTQSIKIMAKDGELVVGPDVLRQLTRILVEDCDKAERGRP